MKRLFTITFLMIAFVGLISAQAFKKSSLVGNLGAGFGWYGYGYGVSSLPAFTVSLEKGIVELEDIGIISIGGIAGIKHASYNYSWASNKDKWTWNDIIVAARGAIHPFFVKNEKVDLYGGLAIGVRLETWKYTSYISGNKENFTDNYTNFLFAIYAGGRYYFTDKLAVFGELGYGLGYLTLGISYKLVD